MGDFFLKNILKIVFVIIGTLIGAGFASGQEIYIFFFSHGIKGLYGILISYTIIGLIIYKTLTIIYKYNIKTYKDLLKKIFVIKDKNKFIEIVNIIINIFILITFFIMIAGFGAYFEQEYKLNSIIGSGILSILCYITLNKNVRGVIKANEILIPILIIFLVIIGFLNIKEIDLSNIIKYNAETSNSNFIIDAIIYSSYNSILLIPVLITLRKYLKTKEETISISIITVLISIILSIIIFFVLIKVDVDIKMLEMPAVYVVSNISEILKYVYGIIILGSIFTTSISLGISFLQNSTKANNYKKIVAIICISALLVSKIGFSNLINSLYSIFGYIGLIEIIKILLF